MEEITQTLEKPAKNSEHTVYRNNANSDTVFEEGAGAEHLKFEPAMSTDMPRLAQGLIF